LSGKLKGRYGFEIDLLFLVDCYIIYSQKSLFLLSILLWALTKIKVY